jgi:hypothetical protein
MDDAVFRKPRVLITIPNQHWVHKLVMARAIAMLSDSRCQSVLEMPSNKPFEATLQDCVDRLVDGPFNWWISIDADNPPERNPLDLITFDKDVIGCPTPIYHWTGKQGERPIYWNAYQYDEQNGLYREWPEREGLQRVDAIGTGCFVAHRRVFEHPDLRYGAFQRRWEKGRVERGNDLAFCERAKEAGFAVWAHYDYPAEHMVEIPLNEISRAIKGLL